MHCTQKKQDDMERQVTKESCCRDCSLSSETKRGHITALLQLSELSSGGEVTQAKIGGSGNAEIPSGEASIAIAPGDTDIHGSRNTNAKFPETSTCGEAEIRAETHSRVISRACRCMDSEMRECAKESVSGDAKMLSSKRFQTCVPRC